MPNNIYGLPDHELDRIRSRDLTCVYCHKTMFPIGSDGPRTDWATIEHRLVDRTGAPHSGYSWSRRATVLDS